MSVEQVGRALEVTGIPPSARHVLLVLATYADPDGSRVWPSLDTVARQTGLARSTVRVAVTELLKAGLMVLVRGSIGRTPSQYKLHLADAKPSGKRIPPVNGSLRLSVGSNPPVDSANPPIDDVQPSGGRIQSVMTHHKNPPDAGARDSGTALARADETKASDPEATPEQAHLARQRLRELAQTLRQNPTPKGRLHEPPPPLAKPLPEPLSVEETERRRREQLAALEAKMRR